jgi:hypothetical protein
MFTGITALEVGKAVSCSLGSSASILMEAKLLRKFTRPLSLLIAITPRIREATHIMEAVAKALKVSDMTSVGKLKLGIQVTKDRTQNIKETTVSALLDVELG